MARLDSPGPTGLRANRCETTADCPTGSVCSEGIRTCVSVNSTTEVVFYAAPPNGEYTATAAPTRLDSNIVSGDSAFEIGLRAPRLVYGTTRAPAPAGFQPRGDAGTGNDVLPDLIPATIQFRRQGSTPAEPLVTVRATSEARMLPGGTTYNWSANLVPGVYDVTITPDASASARVGHLPPWHLEQTVEADAAGAPQPINFVWGTSQFVGRVVNQHGEPIPNVAVRMVDHRHGDRAISTTARTDGMGHFVLLLSSGINAHETPGSRLEISAGIGERTDANTTRFVYQVDRVVLPEGASAEPVLVQLRASQAALEPYLTCVGCVDLRGFLRGDASDGTEPPVHGAVVTIRNDAPLGGELPPGHVAWFEARMQTARDRAMCDAALPDERCDAYFTTRVPPATYGAVVLPPLPFAVASDVIEVGSAGLVGRTLLAPRRSLVRGSIRNALRGDAIQMSNVVVDFIPFAPYLPATAGRERSADLLARRAQTTTNRDGTYSIELDPGPYRVVVRPPPESGFANQVYDGEEVTSVRRSEPQQPQVDRTLDIPLDPPVQVHGRVVDALNAPVSRAVITAFARISVARNAADPFVPPLDIDLGTFVADANGQYTCLLPRAPMR